MVYVDNYNAPFGRMIMCHMVADSPEELLAMVRTIGVDDKWVQENGTPNEHFDICLAKKALALKAGAIEIGFRQYAQIVQAKKRAIEYFPEGVSNDVFEMRKRFLDTEIALIINPVKRLF